MSLTEHNGWVETRTVIEPGAIPCCSCGWSGQRHTTEGEAMEQLEGHFDVVFMEATQPPVSSREDGET